jgi:hypothetical protein
VYRLFVDQDSPKEGQRMPLALGLRVEFVAVVGAANTKTELVLVKLAVAGSKNWATLRELKVACIGVPALEAKEVACLTQALLEVGTENMVVRADIRNLVLAVVEGVQILQLHLAFASSGCCITDRFTPDTDAYLNHTSLNDIV